MSKSLFQMLIETKNHGDVRTTDRTPTSYTFRVTNTWFAKSLMAAWHQRQARFALRYQTHLTVVLLTGSRSSRVDGRGAGVSHSISVFLVIVRWIAVRIHWLGVQITVMLTLMWPRTFIILHFATHARDVAAFSSPVFSTPAIWSHVSSPDFSSSAFSVPPFLVVMFIFYLESLKLLVWLRIAAYWSCIPFCTELT